MLYHLQGCHMDVRIVVLATGYNSLMSEHRKKVGSVSQLKLVLPMRL
jgi:hypothetical protein